MKREETVKGLVIYLVGSLRNENVPIISNKLRKALGENVEIFNSWYHASPDADEFNLKCCKDRGLNYKETLLDWGSQNSFNFDKFHLNRADIVVGLMKIGRSGHLELGYACGIGKKTYMLFPDGEPETCDIMYNFLNDIFFDIDKLIEQLKSDLENKV